MTAQVDRIFCLACAEPGSQAVPLSFLPGPRVTLGIRTDTQAPDHSGRRVGACACGPVTRSACASEPVRVALSPGVHAHDGAQQLAALECLVPPVLPLPPRGRLLRDPPLLCPGECGLVENVVVAWTGEPEAPQHPGQPPALAQGFQGASALLPPSPVLLETGDL